MKLQALLHFLQSRLQSLDTSKAMNHAHSLTHLPKRPKAKYTRVSHFFYSTNLNNLSNNEQDFGGMMTEIVITKSGKPGGNQQKQANSAGSKSAKRDR